MYILWTSVNAVKTSVSVDVDAEVETHKSLVTNHRIRFIVNQPQKKTEMHYSFHGIRPNKTKQLNSCFGRYVAFCVEVLFCGRIHLNMLLWRILFFCRVRHCFCLCGHWCEISSDTNFPYDQLWLCYCLNLYFRCFTLRFNTCSSECCMLVACMRAKF